jgi:hypothetical protein
MVFVLLNKIWIEGGGGCAYSQVYNDIWSSPDGVNWTLSTQSAAWSARMWPCAASGTDGIVWLVGGYAPTDWNNTDGTLKVRYGGNHSDAWYSKDGVDWRQFKADNGADLPDGSTLEPRHAATCFVASNPDANTQSLVVIAGSAGSSPDARQEAVSNSITTLPLPATSTLP